MTRPGSAALLCSLMLLAWPVAANGAVNRCVRPSGATVVRHTPTAVVYSRGPGAAAEGVTRYWRCLRSTGRRTQLASGRRVDISGLLDTVTRFRLSGRYLAYVAEQHDYRYSYGSISVVVVDLRIGRSHSARRMLASSATGVDDPLTVTHLILTARGTAAWYQTARPTPAAEVSDIVSKLDRRGRRRTLDVAPLGSIHGPRLSVGRIARWTTNGVPRSSRLDP